MSTIVAISTAPGVGGIGIVRMSGEKAFEIIRKIFVSKSSLKEIKGYSIKYGHIKNTKSNKIIDEALVTFFKNPKSYTGEDLCEINSHGGNIILKEVLEECLKNGAKLAEPGEFTKRAFINGRIDLAQAEAVIDIINAKSKKEANEAIKQLSGEMSQQIASVKKKLIGLMAIIDTTIDYPEYDVETTTKEEIIVILNETEDKLIKMVNSFENGKILKQGIKTAIVGSPNAGKSSLLNAILKEERAIVTEFEGTTRDTIEEFVTIKGIPLKIIDTAGIRNTDNEIEKIGINKTKQLLKESDLVIAIFDITKKLKNEDIEILEAIKNKKTIIVLNKTDINNNILENEEKLMQSNKRVIKISAKNNENIEEIYEEIQNMFQLNEINLDNEVIVTNERHKECINDALKETKEAQKAIKSDIPIDIVAIHIKEIMINLSKITGENITEDIIKEIFTKFCLGK